MGVLEKMREMRKNKFLERHSKVYTTGDFATSRPPVLHWMIKQPIRDNYTQQSEQSASEEEERLRRREASPHGTCLNRFVPSEERHHREAVDEATEPWICVHGHENVPDNIFCGKCGCPRERPVWPAVDPTVTHHIDEELAVEQVEPGTPEPHIRVKRIDMQLPRQVAPPHKWYEMDIAESELTNESLSDMEEEEAELAEKLAREQYVEKLKAMETNYENVKRESGEDEQEEEATEEKWKATEEKNETCLDDGTLRRAAEAMAVMNDWDQASTGVPPPVMVEPGSWGEPVGDQDNSEDDNDSTHLSSSPSPVQRQQGHFSAVVVPALNLGGRPTVKRERGQHHHLPQERHNKVRRKGHSVGEEFDETYDDNSSSISPARSQVSPSTNCNAADRHSISRVSVSHSRGHGAPEEIEAASEDKENSVPSTAVNIPRSRASTQASSVTKEKVGDTLQRMRAILTDLDKKRLQAQESKLRHGQQWTDGLGTPLSKLATPGLWYQERVIAEATAERVRATGKSAGPIVDYADIAERMATMSREMMERKEARLEARKQYEEDLRARPGYHESLATNIVEARRDARLKVTERVAKKMQERCLSVHSSVLVESQRLTMDEFAPTRRELFTPRALLNMTPRTREASRQDRLEYIRPRTPRTMGRYVAQLDAPKRDVLQMSQKKFTPPANPLSYGNLKPTYPGKLEGGNFMVHFPEGKMERLTTAVNSQNLRLLSSVFRFAGRNGNAAP